MCIRVEDLTQSCVRKEETACRGVLAYSGGAGVFDTLTGVCQAGFLTELRKG